MIQIHIVDSIIESLGSERRECGDKECSVVCTTGRQLQVSLFNLSVNVLSTSIIADTLLNPECDPFQKLKEAMMEAMILGFIVGQRYQEIVAMEEMVGK